MPSVQEKLEKYYPDDHFGRIVAEVYQDFWGQWLSESELVLLCRALLTFKSHERWLENEILCRQRVSYLLNPSLAKMDRLVFLTYPLFEQDIVEHGKIDARLHNPAVFVALPVAHLLGNSYPVHLVIENEDLFGSNNDLHTFGALVVSEENVVLKNIESISGHRKQAVTETTRGVFKVDPHQASWQSGQYVVEKGSKRQAKVMEIVPGEKGGVELEFDEGERQYVPLDELYRRFAPI